GSDLIDQYTTNASGQFTTKEYVCGDNWYIQEISPSSGYLLDTTKYPVGAEPDKYTLEHNQIPIGVKEQAIKGKIQIHKQYETLEGTPKDEAAAEFQVYLKSAGSYDKAKASERDTIITSASGYAVTKNMPYGTYIVHQTKGGAGREFVDDFEVMISANNQTYSYELLNELKNGQLKIIKTSDDGKVEGIQFRVTRLADNYSKVYTTDASDLILTETLPIFEDNEGKTKYQYRVEELDTKETFGYALPDPQIVELSEGEIASVCFHNVPIEIGTKATVEGEKEVDPLDKVTLTDTVSYTGLVPGKEYRATGVLMDKETGEKLLVDGKEITAETVFVPETKNGSVDVTFIFDATGLHGKEIVVFEDLYRENVLLATHADINDEGQTIKVKNPEIGTTASFEGEKEIDPLDKVTLTDTVSYKDLTPGKEYRVTGVLMDKSNGKELLINGEKVTAEATFVATEASGSVDVTFIFDATGLHGKGIVVFEDLYRENVLLATHADINDEGQTVKIKNPEIGTKATADSKKEITADKITITDVVSYKDLTPGKEYKLTGVLMNKATNDKLLIDGKEITAEATFTPKATTGEVEMTFTFDARELTAETEVVVFETLYRDELEFAAHADISDADQTVKILPLHGSISTIKVDAGDSQHRLSGAVFGIYRDVNGDGRYTEGIDTFVGNMREKETGVYELDGLLYGKFLIHEKQAPSGYSQDKNYYSFEITRDGEKVQFEVKPGMNFPNSAFPKTGSSNHGVYAALLALAVSCLGLGTMIFCKVKKESK
uniref:VaFE repeat-containing surface-anchored protein n=1 Tax=Hominenteromicrobium sp. TaxID=3073581 RepID=UPI003AAE4CA9